MGSQRAAGVRLDGEKQMKPQTLEVDVNVTMQEINVELAKEIVFLGIYDFYETEAGNVVTICRYCGRMNGEHRPSCLGENACAVLRAALTCEIDFGKPCACGSGGPCKCEDD